MLGVGAVNAAASGAIVIAGKGPGIENRESIPVAAEDIRSDWEFGLGRVSRLERGVFVTDTILLRLCMRVGIRPDFFDVIDSSASGPS